MVGLGIHFIVWWGMEVIGFVFTVLSGVESNSIFFFMIFLGEELLFGIEGIILLLHVFIVVGKLSFRWTIVVGVEKVVNFLFR